MAFRFWRRIQLAPGVTLNLSKSAASLSFGPRGAKYTISPRGNRATAGIPGTGLFYTMRDPGAGRGQERGASAPMVRARDRLTLGFFQRLITPAAERAFVDGLKALNEGDDSEALVLLDRSASLADAAWLAGMLHLKSENFDQAERCLLDALERRHKLDSLFSKYGVNATISLPITPEISAHVRPRERGTLLALVEVYQLQGRSGDALIRLDQLLDLDKSDPVVLLSFAELALDQPNPEHLRRIAELSASVETRLRSIRRCCSIGPARWSAWACPMRRSTFSRWRSGGARTARTSCCGRSDMSVRCSTMASAAKHRPDASSSAFMPRIRGSRMSPNGSGFDVRFRRRSLADEDINRRDGT